MDDVTRRIADLSPEAKRVLLAQLLRKKIDGSKDWSPLSQGQRALWFLYRLAPESAAYNLLYAARLRSPIDVPALQRAVQALIQRYPILTTTYAMSGKEPIQRFAKGQTLPVEVIDASSWSENYLRQQVEEEGNRPFSLEQGPILRLKLYRCFRSDQLSEASPERGVVGRNTKPEASRQSGVAAWGTENEAQDAVLSLTIHHIAADLWSLDLLTDELCVLYAADRAGVQAPLPAIGTHYADYVRWQTDMLAGPQGEQHWIYWQQKLAGEVPVLSLLTDKPRPSVQTYKGASHSFQFSEKLSQRLRTLANTEKVTLYTLMLAAFKVLLFRYTDQEDLLIGTPTLGRNRADQERVIGYFANPVVLRTNFSGNPTFKELLDQVRQTVIEALDHQDYPFSLLVERLQPRRDPSYSPLIQALFIWDKPRTYGEQSAARFGQGETATRLAQHMPQLEPYLAGQQGAPFDLTLTIFEVDGALSADFRYNVDLFEASTLARMEHHFQTLLTGIAAHPEQHILELPLLTEAERQHILVEWNNTQSDYPEHTSIPQLFEQQVQRTPEAVAVVFEGKQLTYSKLNRQANRVAHALQALEVGPDTLVGVCMERSFEMVIALLAILKAGGAYVPLEPTYPRERLAYMIQDAHLPVLLTQRRLRGILAGDGTQVLCLDDAEYLATLHNEGNPISLVQPDNLMYMIYTSGSTGKPKGVMNIHRALCNRLHWMQQAYQLTPADRVMQKTPFSFDVSVWEFFWPLLYGACLVVARPGGHQDPAYLVSLITEQQITTLHFVPSMLHMFLEEPGLARCTSLKRVICSGEALPFELQERYFSRINADLHNLYGPTEAAIDVTYWQCQRESNDIVIPIGYPIANTQMYILNRALQPVPIGVAGELYIGGVGLARGYFNQPELTAEKFIPDPFSKTLGTRLFKTGDLARYRSDGAIEFLGRIDHQVKIRGVRIELGEIEAVLTQHPAMKEAVVVALGNTLSTKRLVAYLVLTQAARNQRISLEELRAFLKEKLPQDMIPSAFMFLEALPLNSNGKVNRSVLPTPDIARPELEAPYVAPRTPTEAQLAHIWAEVLGIDKVGIHDNFFTLGGASIQSLQVITKASEAGIHLSPELLFEHQTIAELAAITSQEQFTLLDQPVRLQPHAQVNVASTPYQPAQLNLGHSIIESIGVYLPPKVVSTKEVLENCGTPIRFPLEQLTGIKTRRMAGETEFAVDLARKAIENCLANSKYNPEDIDLLICSSISRYNGPNFHVTFEPSTSTQLQRHFGFKNALAFDVSNACTGMFTALYIVDAFLKAGLIRRGMVVSGEYITHLTKSAQREIEGYMDSRLACLTVGDAGAAVILETTLDKTLGFHEFDMYTLGRYYDFCIAKASEAEYGGAMMYTDAVKVSALNIQQAVSHAAHMMERSRWPHEAFHRIIMHQTSKMTIYDAAREINSYFGKELCHEGNLINNIAERGNTASTTHFVAVMDHILSNRIQSGENAVFAITGSGVNIGTAIYTFDDLPDRLRRAALEGRKPDKVAEGQKTFIPLLPRNQRIRVESIGTFPVDSLVKRETLEMVRIAAENCLNASACSRSDIDLLIYAGVYRDDFICEPAIAAMVAGTLQINDTIQSQQDKKSFSFDLFNGAVGFLNACYVATGMIRAHKANNVMVVASEVENNLHILPAELRGLEETASVAILDESPDGKTGFGNFVFKHFPEYMGAFASYTKFYNGRACLHFEQDPTLEAYYQQCILATVHELLSIEQLDLAQMKVILPPQISSGFIQKLSDTLKLNRDKFVDVEASHDLFTSSLPYALQHVRERTMVKSGDIGLIIAVGAGVQVGCATYYF